MYYMYMCTHTHMTVTSLVGCALRITILDGLHKTLRNTVAKEWAKEVDLMKEFSELQGEAYRLKLKEESISGRCQKGQR